ncbi:MAG: sigma-70 family RNA polymerase sigma factor [Myxococcota bacterium]
MSDELNLLERWRNGDSKAGEALTRAYYREIFERLRRGLQGNAELAAEQTQQVFEIAASHREDLVTDFRRYLHGVARFKLWEYIRRQRSNGPVDPQLSQMIDPSHGALSVMVRAEDARLLVQGLLSLPIEEQVCLMWAYADKKTHREIAERLGLTTPQISGRIFRAKEKLRRQLERFSQSTELRSSIDMGFNTWMESLRRRVEYDDEERDGEQEPPDSAQRAERGLIDAHDEQAKVGNLTTQDPPMAESDFVAPGPTHALQMPKRLNITIEQGIDRELADRLISSLEMTFPDDPDRTILVLQEQIAERLQRGD